MSENITTLNRTYNYGVVILNYKNYELTDTCVRKLLEIKAPVMIVVVDNNSENGSYEELQSRFTEISNVKVIKNKVNAGYAGGNNFGFRYILDIYKEIKYICVMNPDVEITYPQIFEHMANKLESDDKLAAITGLMITNGDLDIKRCCWHIPGKFEIAYGHSVLWKNKGEKLICTSDGTASVEALPGSFYMIKRTVYEQLGGFDEGTFLYNEENVFASQIKSLGMTNALSVNDFYLHNHPKGERQKLIVKLKSRKVGNDSRRYLCSKYYGRLSKVLLEIVILSNYLVISVKHMAGNLICMIRRPM